MKVGGGKDKHRGRQQARPFIENQVRRGEHSLAFSLAEEKKNLSWLCRAKNRGSSATATKDREDGWKGVTEGRDAENTKERKIRYVRWSRRVWAGKCDVGRHVGEGRYLLFTPT